MRNLEKKLALRILRIFTEVIWYSMWIVGAILTIHIIIQSCIMMISGTDLLGKYLDITHNLPLQRSNIQITSAFEIVKMLISIILSLYIIYHLRILFKTLQKGKVFTLENAQRIQKIAYPLVVIAIITFNFYNLIVALFTIILAEIFKYGVELENEKKLTV